MASGKRSPPVEAVRKARLCTSSLQSFRELKKKKKEIVVLPLMCGWQRYVLLEKILNSPPCRVLTDHVMWW